MFSAYINEFMPQKETLQDFIQLSCNMCRDFFEGKIDEQTISALIHQSLIHPKTKKFHFKPYINRISDIIFLLHTLLDITWVKPSDQYEEYLSTLRSDWEIIVQKYSVTLDSHELQNE